MQQSSPVNLLQYIWIGGEPTRKYQCMTSDTLGVQAGFVFSKIQCAHQRFCQEVKHIFLSSAGISSFEKTMFRTICITSRSIGSFCNQASTMPAMGFELPFRFVYLIIVYHTGTFKNSEF